MAAGEAHDEALVVAEAPHPVELLLQRHRVRLVGVAVAHHQVRDAELLDALDVVHRLYAGEARDHLEGIAIAAVLLGEKLGPLDILGVAIIAGGILAVQIAKQPRNQ